MPLINETMWSGNIPTYRQKGVTLNVPAIVLAGTLKMYQQVAVINVNNMEMFLLYNGPENNNPDKYIFQE